MAQENVSPEARALAYFRHRRGWTPQMLAAALGFSDHRQILGYERGDRPLSREYLEALLAPLDIPSEAVDAFLFNDRLIVLDPPEQAASPLALTREEMRWIDRTVMTAGWAMAEDLRGELILQRKAEKAAAARLQARELWSDLKKVDRKERRDLVAVFPEYWRWALAELLCHESIRAASHQVDEALHLAELALAIAERAPEEPRWCSRLKSYCLAHIANARRVAADFDEADVLFVRAWDLWRAGEGSDPTPLAEWRLFDLEASLGRAERRFPEALEFLGRALAACGEDLEARGRILLNKEHVLDQMGNLEGSLAVLEEAGPYVEISGDPHLLFSLRFKRANILCHQKRYEDAGALLAGVRELAVQQASDINLIRVVWLESKAASGVGREEEAMAGLEQVRKDFTLRDLPYEAALSSLDLAVLWLKAGRRAEVRDLALAMAWIFRAKKIHREALAALRLFCEAAEQDAVSVELTQQVIAEIEKVRRSASRAGNRPGGRE